MICKIEHDQFLLLQLESTSLNLLADASIKLIFYSEHSVADEPMSMKLLRHEMPLEVFSTIDAQSSLYAVPFGNIYTHNDS